MTAPTVSVEDFGAAFAGPDAPAGPHWLVLGDGLRLPLPVGRWHGPPESALAGILGRCAGPTIDLGCGPGRLTAELAGRGLVALGVDVSAGAVRLARQRGATALRRDVLAPLPGEGRWAHALLIDGNIGIGGDPVRLLRRTAGLLRTGGTALVELAPPGTGLWRGPAYVSTDGTRGPTFRWARVGVELAGAVAAASGFRAAAVLPAGGRWFVELARR
ncbi:methyltransferase domain-containing protein [Micromonospora auratinigra]|uniref:Methyltransferase domain-containing protein n=1 Tax=Micromonospora auratinigra TaxID=261654 RepID=A0A1A9A9K4_9ACTN|nr:class I SAM-dependent methyltransferase [Micromonospora auratinigra]SBT52852.1 Methyltransferase domain-containing protein [Micromonospora auratinigra]